MQIDFLCKEFGLGQALTPPVLLQGGLIHEMWHIQTTVGEFAIKRINQLNTKLLSNTILPIHHAEFLAQHYQQRGLRVRVARQTLSASYHAICENGHQWMVFPWVKGRIKYHHEIELSDAERIGKFLVDLHQHATPMANLRLPSWFGFPDSHWQALSDQAIAKNLSWGEFAKAKQSVLQFWSVAALDVKPSITQNLIISHRDVSTSNIIWREDGQPVLIDWEYAGLINPKVEIFNTAMTWALHRPGQINESIFNAVVAAAGHDFKPENKELLSSYAGYLLEWCEFNMQRSVLDDSIKDIATFEIVNVIKILEVL
jgi:thiamine kinase-like enzyme